MKPLLRAIALLYPHAWRARYGHEFEALVEDMTPGWRDVPNVLFGAIVMHLSKPSVITLAAGLTLAGSLAGVAVALARPPVFASSSRVEVRTADSAADGSRVEQSMQRVKATLDRAALDRRNTIVTVVDGDHNPLVLRVTGTAASAENATRTTEQALTAM